MKVIILSTSERKGGAAVAAHRLMCALNKNGHDASMLVRDKQTDDENVISIHHSFIKKKINFIRFVWERLVIFVTNGLSKKNLFAVSLANTGANISNHPLIKDADVIHLHWINQGFLSLKNIRQLAKLGKPIVWTMHDMWPCTAICHHARECNNYQAQCGNCFFLKHPQKNDLSKKIFKKKQQLYQEKNISFVTCSQWLNSRAVAGSLLDGHKVAVIPNPLDTDLFTPLDKQKCCEKLGLPANKKLLLFSAANVSDERKGFSYLAEAVRLLSMHEQDIELVITGNNKQGDFPALPFKVHFLNYVTDEKRMVEIYNAVDVYITPSLEENLPNTIMEAMACGIPCVGFNVGGIPEMIDHQKNGYVAGYKSADDLAQGINWVLFEADYEQLSENAQQKVKTDYAEDAVTKKYFELYQSL